MLQVKELRGGNAFEIAFLFGSLQSFKFIYLGDTLLLLLPSYEYEAGLF